MTSMVIYRVRDLVFKVREGTLDAEIIRDIVENNLYASLLDQIEPGCICLDVGAHIGTFAILAASLGAQVHAFEPIPANYQLLLENIQLNGLSNQITAYNQAVWSHDTVKKMTFSEENTGAGGLVWPGDPGTIQVSCAGLHGFLEEKGITHCRGIKLDCEGSEFEILGALSLSDLQRFDIITLEYHGMFGNVPALVEHLQQSGFISHSHEVVENIGFIDAVSYPYLLASSQNSLRQTLAQLKQQQLHAVVQLDDSPYTRIPLLGWLWKQLRQGAHELVVYYCNQLADQQNQINRDVYSALKALSGVVGAMPSTMPPGDSNRNKSGE